MTLRTFGWATTWPVVATLQAAVARQRLDREHDLGRGSQGVGAQVHRCGASVVGGAGDGDVEELPAGDSRDDADRHPGRGEHRALLDVQLDEGVEEQRIPRRGGDRAGSGLPPAARMRWATVTPSSSTWANVAASSRPTQALLPVIPAVPRAPSSLAKAATMIPCRKSAVWSAAATSTAATTP